MRILRQEYRPVDSVRGAILADGLRDRENVRFVESIRERCAAVAGRAECDTLGSFRRIRPAGIISRDELRNIGQLRRTGRFPCVRMDAHFFPAWYRFQVRNPIIVFASWILPAAII